MSGTKRLKRLDGSGVEPRIAKFDNALREILKDDELYKRVRDALNDQLRINVQPTAKFARPPKLRPQFAAVMIDRLASGNEFATLTFADFFGDGKHGYKVLARLAADKLVSVPEACMDIPPQLSESEETRKRSLSFAASDVLAAIAMKARHLDGADGAILEIHSCGKAPQGFGREARGAGVFADEKGFALLKQACTLIQRMVAA